MTRNDSAWLNEFFEANSRDFTPVLAHRAAHVCRSLSASQSRHSLGLELRYPMHAKSPLDSDPGFAACREGFAAPVE